MNAGRYLLRKDPKAQARLDQIAEGEGLADLIQDLKDLADFAVANAKVLAAAPRLPKDAVAQARTLAASLTDGVDSAGANDAQARRNQVYAVLASAVDEVRAGARFLFHDEPKLLAPMLSHYSADRKRSLRGRGQTPRGPNAPGADRKLSRTSAFVAGDNRCRACNMGIGSRRRPRRVDRCPGRSTDVPGGSTDVPGGSTDVPGGSSDVPGRSADFRLLNLDGMKLP